MTIKTIKTMIPNGANRGMVLQGFFRRERFRAQATAAAAAIVQPKELGFWAGKAVRPELMPAKMQRTAVQPKAAPMSPVSAWPGAPRPELLPGMGRSRLAPQPATVQWRAADGVTVSQVPNGMLRLAGAGKPLDDGIRAKMESFFGADFSGVRVHEGPAAQAMGALAFTLGETLYFAPGLYDPTTRAGVELIGHELTHVVQQREGRVDNPYGRGIAIVQDPALEAEADKMGRQIADKFHIGQSINVVRPGTSAADRIQLAANPQFVQMARRGRGRGRRRGRRAAPAAAPPGPPPAPPGPPPAPALPAEIAAEIISYLPNRDLLNTNLVNHDWHQETLRQAAKNNTSISQIYQAIQQENWAAIQRLLTYAGVSIAIIAPLTALYLSSDSDFWVHLKNIIELLMFGPPVHGRPHPWDHRRGHS